MPEQPPDPRNYDMRIPPPPDPSKKNDAQKPSSDQSKAETNTAKNTDVAGEKSPPTGTQTQK